MSIHKEQLRDMFKATQAKGSEIRDILIKTREGEEKDFEELIVLMDIPIPTLAREPKHSK
jgi:hypothetical protein